MALAVIAGVSVVAAMACGSGTSNNDKTATAGAGGAKTPAVSATTAVTAGATSGATAAATAKATTYPLTVTDMLGRSVTIDAEPKSIAAVSPTAVEYVYAVGATSKTRTTSVNYPPEAISAKDIGSAYQPSLELIAAESPDLIVADSVLQPQLKTSLESLGKPVLYIGAENFNDVPKGLRLAGEVLNNQAAGEKAAADLEKKLADIKAKLPDAKPKVLIINGTPDDFFAAKPESYVGDLAAQLDADNVAAGQPDVGQFPGYTKLSLEAILTSKPDVVLSITAGPPGGTTISSSLAQNSAWADVPAVKNNRVSEIDAALFLQAPGPRAGVALDTLAKLLYPEQFP
jgi:iron complex transport system substrate-binding protein